MEYYHNKAEMNSEFGPFLKSEDKGEDDVCYIRQCQTKGLLLSLASTRVGSVVEVGNTASKSHGPEALHVRSAA